MAKRYLVSGCAGFIASKVAELLLEAGHQVVGIDNLNDAYDPRLKQWRLAQLQPHAAFRFRELDITDRVALEGLFAADADSPEAGEPEELPYSAVINLAARAGVRPSVENPWVYFQANCDGTLNLLELCRRFGVRKFVLASTSSLYGEHNPVPFAEDADTNNPCRLTRHRRRRPRRWPTRITICTGSTCRPFAISPSTDRPAGPT